jgi:RHS repeat-associated protein
MTTTTYPGASRIIYNDYGLDDGIFDHLNRIYRIRATNSTSTILTEYAYDGAGRLATADYQVPGVKLDLYQGTTGTYAGYDRYGQTVRQGWDKYGTGAAVRDRFDYTYDYAGNRLTRDARVDVINSGYTDARDQKYSYDGIQRLKDYDQGTWSGTAITSSNKQRSWKLDQLGNWAQTFTDLSQSTSEQTRTHNEANELTAINSVSTYVAEDAAGNMTKIPKSTNWSAAFDLKYDAWNRLVEVKDGSTTITANKYDGLGKRIQRVVGSDTYDYYYNESWQLLEERKNADADPFNQYVWHPYYIDALAVRYYDVNTSGSGVVDYYYLHDANFNVTAIVDSGGTVQERYNYTPYGEVTYLSADFSTKSTQATAIGNTHLYTGRELDPETGLQLNRERFYAVHLGRWTTRDQVEYRDSFNLYEYVGGRPTIANDPTGQYEQHRMDCYTKCLNQCKGKDPFLPCYNPCFQDCVNPRPVPPAPTQCQDAVDDAKFYCNLAAFICGGAVVAPNPGSAVGCLAAIAVCRHKSNQAKKICDRCAMGSPAQPPNTPPGR